MSDNIDVTPGTGKTIAGDDIAGVLHQRVKVEFGADGSATEASSSNPLPVVQTGTSALPTGAATEATSATRLSESDFDTKAGSLTETAPTTDTASSGLNGRLQRIAQRLTSLIALLPGSLGQKVRASSLAVTLSSEDITTLTPPAAITGFATAAKQPALGTAGTASADVITIQGKTAMVPVLIDGSATTQPVSLAGTQSVNQAQVAGTTVDTNSGNKSAGTQRIVLATDQPTMTNPQPVTLANTTITGTVVVDDLAAAPTGSTVPANAQYQGNIAQTALPTAASVGNLTGALGDKFGRTIFIPEGMRDIVGSQRTTITTSTSETTIVTAAASVFNDLFLLTFKNTSGSALRVDIRDTTAGTIIDDIYLPAGDTRGWAPTRSLPQSAVNTNWTAQCSASVTDVRVTAWFVKNK